MRYGLNRGPEAKLFVSSRIWGITDYPYRSSLGKAISASTVFWNLLSPVLNPPYQVTLQLDDITNKTEKKIQNIITYPYSSRFALVISNV